MGPKPASQRAGFSLVELMIVVAIVAVLAGLAVLTFSRWKRRAVRAEVATVLGAIALREEAYRAEFGAYLSCASALQRHPALGSSEPTKKPVGTNACWQNLGLTTDPELYCSYSVWGGQPNTWPADFPDPDKAAFGGTAPPTVWYLGIGECDLDGVADGAGNNSIFYRTHQNTTLGERNPDK